jgi:hypothetical protein
VRKVPVIPAALLAATFAFALPSFAEARSGRKTVSKRSVTRRPPAEKRVAVIDSVDVVELPVYGPFLPVEPHNYPQLPCPPVDEVVIAELHEPDAIPLEDPEPEIAASSSSLPPRMARLARRFGSLFRPKSAKAKVKPEDVDLGALLSERLLIPVEGVDAEKLRDSFLETRGRHARHLAIDIGAPRGTPVVATADGEILKLTREARGGITIYQKDSTGQYLFFYCHLKRYAAGLEVGQQVRRGDVIGYVGSTGRVIGGPHLHFSITRLPDDAENFREGMAINPYLLFIAGVP